MGDETCNEIVQVDWWSRFIVCWWWDEWSRFPWDLLKMNNDEFVCVDTVDEWSRFIEDEW